MAPTANPVSGRLFSLDILRGVAAFLVLCHHLPARANLQLAGSEYAVRFLYRIGWCGVDLFFVLSGFLITGLLFKELDRTGTLQLGRFWLRRGLKIWPAYFAAYGLFVLVAGTRAFLLADEGRWNDLLGGILPNALFVQNYCAEALRWPNSWSLAVEEHFYLVLPLLLLGLAWWDRQHGEIAPGQRFRRLLVVGLVLATAVLVLRCWRGIESRDWSQVYYATHFRMDGLFCGVVLAALHRYRPDWSARLAARWPLLIALAVLSLCLPAWFPLHYRVCTYTLGFTALYLAFGGAVLVAGNYPDWGKDGPRALTLVPRAFAWLGTYSYTVYLAHSVVMELPGIDALRLTAGQLGGTLSPLTGLWADRLLYFSLCIGGGVLLSYAVERPFLRWRDRWVPSTSAQKRRVAQLERTPSGCLAAVG